MSIRISEKEQETFQKLVNEDGILKGLALDEDNDEVIMTFHRNSDPANAVVVMFNVRGDYDYSWMEVRVIDVGKR